MGIYLPFSRVSSFTTFCFYFYPAMQKFLNEVLREILFYFIFSKNAKISFFPRIKSNFTPYKLDFTPQKKIFTPYFNFLA